MRKFFLALAATLVAVVVFVSGDSATRPAQADEGCLINVKGTLGIVICGGQVVDQLGLPTVTVTAPPLPAVTLPPVQITQLIPGQTRTVTARPEPQTTTIQVPGPTVTKTVTAQPKPTATKTVTAKPSPQPTVTVTPDAVPQTTAPNSSKGDSGIFDFNFGRHSTLKAAGIGFLSLLAAMGLLLLALYGGYILGYKDSERKDTDFMRALQDQIMVRNKNS